jgi:hypothetical protein
MRCLTCGVESPLYYEMALVKDNYRLQAIFIDYVFLLPGTNGRTI